MVNRLVAILLICALVVDNLSRILVTAAFELNQQYIAEYFCINKDKPLLHCDGKCFLAKKLKETEEKEKKTEKELQKVSYQPAFITEKTSLAFLPVPDDIDQPTEFSFALPTRTLEIFRPPRA